MRLLISDGLTISRQDALKNNLSRYKGDKCLKGHTGIRYTNNGNCVECKREEYIPTGRKRGKEADPNKELARKNGEIYFYSGKPCKRGHLAKRRMQSGSCYECDRLCYKLKEKDYGLRSKYNITLEEYNKMFWEQNGKCAICDNEESIIDPKTNKAKKLSVDHCHETGRIRGLLCGNCNRGIGLLNHNVKLIKKAALYCEAV